MTAAIRCIDGRVTYEDRAALTIGATCPTCDGALRVEAGGVTTGIETRAVLRCVRSAHRWIFTAHLEPVRSDAEYQLPGERFVPAPPRCGTDAGWNRHYRRGEQPCDACRTAHSEAAAAWKARNPDRTRRQRRPQRIPPGRDSLSEVYA